MKKILFTFVSSLVLVSLYSFVFAQEVPTSKSFIGAPASAGADPAGAGTFTSPPSGIAPASAGFAPASAGSFNSTPAGSPASSGGAPASTGSYMPSPAVTPSSAGGPPADAGGPPDIGSLIPHPPKAK